MGVSGEGSKTGRGETAFRKKSGDDAGRKTSRAGNAVEESGEPNSRYGTRPGPLRVTETS